MNRLSIKMLLYRALQLLRIVPSIWMMRNPWKIAEYFKVLSGVSLEKQHVVLDLGCGRGLQTQVLARRCGKVIGVDIDKMEIARARQLLHKSCVERKVEFLCARLEDANLAASSLDRVFSFCVLEHIANLGEVLTGIVRLLKPGGELHVSVDSLAPISNPTLLAKHRQDALVVQYFTQESLKRQLEAAGLQVLEVEPLFTSQFAVREYQTLIMQGSYRRGLMGSMLFYKRLREEERNSRGTSGIKLVGRARRPSRG